MKQLFLTSSGADVLDDIADKISPGARSMRVAFIDTAAEAENKDPWWVRKDKKKLLDLGFDVDQFSITGMSKVQLDEKVKNMGMIYICGGNSFYLLDQVIKTGFDELIKKKIENGIVYIGSSAGSVIAGVRIDLVSDLDDPSVAPDLDSTGLGIVDLSILPHWGCDECRKEYIKGIESMYTEGVKIVPLTNQQYLWVEGDSMKFIQV